MVVISGCWAPLLVDDFVGIILPNILGIILILIQ